MKSSICAALAGILWLLASAGAGAQNLEEHDYDARNGAEINRLCAGCHGEFGEGSGDGEYPRLAGLPAKYLVEQILAFRTRERTSTAMEMYATERELPEDDLLDIARYLSEIELLELMPPVDPDLAAYEKLLIASRVLNIPSHPGDVEAGAALYASGCKKCHGKEGRGRGSRPALAGQHSLYLERQIEKFRAGERDPGRMGRSLAPLTETDVENLLAYLSTVDD